MLNFNSFHDYSQFTQIQGHQKRLIASQLFFRILHSHTHNKHSQQYQTFYSEYIQDMRIMQFQCIFSLSTKVVSVYSTHLTFFFCFSRKQQQTKRKFNTIFLFFSSILNVIAGTCVHQTVCMPTNGKVVNMYGRVLNILCESGRLCAYVSVCG